MTTTKVHLEVRDRVAWITLDGQATRNALDEESSRKLVDTFAAINADTSIGAAVVTGAGAAFCSGADRAVLKALAGAPADRAHAVLDTIYAAFREFGKVQVPTIAAVNGAAVGAGLNLALAADVRLVAEDAALIPGFAEAKIHPGGGHLHLLTRAAGPQTAAALGVFGQRLTGSRAAALGLAWQAVPLPELHELARRMAAPVAADPQLARALAASMRETTHAGVSWDDAITVERKRQMWSFARTRPAQSKDP